MPRSGPGSSMAARGARASGTPFISFFAPAEMLTLAREAGFREARHVSAADLTQRYFAGGSDGLRPPTNAEELLVASTGCRYATARLTSIPSRIPTSSSARLTTVIRPITLAA